MIGLYLRWVLERPRCSTDSMPFFFQKNWRVVGTDVREECLGILKYGRSAKRSNATNSLHSEGQESKTDGGLCKMLQKVVTKVVANRIKGILP